MISRKFEALTVLAGALILPPACPVCRRATARADALCPECWRTIRYIDRPLCPVYGTPFEHQMPDGMRSAAAIADPPPFERSRSAVFLGDVARTLVHEFKYRDNLGVARLMAIAMTRAGFDLIEDADLIIPIPLHRWRLWRRRYNQSALLAGQLSALSAVPWSAKALQRVRATRQQVGLNMRQRAENVRGAFRVPADQMIEVQGRTILLIDDVYTSGATVKAASRALVRAKASKVDVLTFARAER